MEALKQVSVFYIQKEQVIDWNWVISLRISKKVIRCLKAVLDFTFYFFVQLLVLIKVATVLEWS